MPVKFGRPFTLNGAKHFCRPVVGAAPPAPTSFKDLIETSRSAGTSLTEGQPDFEPFRIQALREADRRLFLAISNYRRSRDLLIGSSASWSWVTMYDSSFHAATAILGCLGVSVDPGPDGGVLIDVKRESPAQSTPHSPLPVGWPNVEEGISPTLLGPVLSLSGPLQDDVAWSRFGWRQSQSIRILRGRSRSGILRRTIRLRLWRSARD